MDFTDLLGHFDVEDEQHDGSFLAHCPVPSHPDSSPSFVISVTTDRAKPGQHNVLATCRKGCATREALDAVGLRMRDLFDVKNTSGVAIVKRDATVSDEARMKILPRGYAHAEALRTTEDERAQEMLADRFGIHLSEWTTDRLFDLGIGYADGRLTFLARTADGNAAYMQGRALDSDADPRWKGDVGTWDKTGYIGEYDPGRPTIVCEGPSDALTVALDGRYNALAVRGSGNAGHVAERAAELADTVVYVAGDGDSAGRDKFNPGVVQQLPHAMPLPVPDELDLNKIYITDPSRFADALDELTASTGPEEIDVVPEDADPVDTEDWDKLAAELSYSKDTPVQHVSYARFVTRHSGRYLRYMEHIGWHRWNGKIWEATGDDGAAFQSVTDAAALLSQHALGKSGSASLMQGVVVMMNGPHRRAIVSEMEKLRELRATVSEFDTHRHLLTFKNGIVDLRTGELLPHDPKLMMTQITNIPYTPTAKAPRFMQFLEEIFPGQTELQGYYQRFLGMCITGEVKDHALGVWYGEHGRNGKGTTVRTMRAAFGDSIVKEVDFSMYEGGRGKEPHTEHLSALRGVRMAIAQEGEQEVPINTARVKKHTGGDSIQGRHLHGKVFNFEPTFTLVLATNHLPEFAAGGAALWARTKAILFGVSFAGREDPDLEPTIQGPELEGVAAWVVEGARQYYAAGRLHDIDAVRAATEMHKQEVDPLRALVGELFEYDEGAEVPRTAFNRKLKEWREDNGDRTNRYSPGNVKKQLLSQNVGERRSKSDGWMYTGIRFPEDPVSAALREQDRKAEANGEVAHLFPASQ